MGTSVSMLKAPANDQNIFASTGPGLVGVLAGTALLGVEQWAVPAMWGFTFATLNVLKLFIGILLA